jgi:hypothetical protein
MHPAVTFHEPVFVIDQPWAGPVFGWHCLVENFARVAPFLEEIKNQKMKILVSISIPFIKKQTKQR